MSKVWRKVKASLTIGAMWGAGWFSAGIAMFLAGARADVPFPLAFGLFGFLAGTAFSGVLMLTEGRRGSHRLSIGRFALWGALGGAALAGVFGGLVFLAEGALAPLGVTLVVFPIAGALSASGTLAIARGGAGGGQRLDGGGREALTRGE